MINIETARNNMISQQIRTSDVLDSHLLSLFKSTPREAFVPNQFQNFAFADMEIPLDHDQVMMTPRDEAIMLQSLAIKPHDKILEIGTGTGYVTALLAQLGSDVYSIDIFPDFINEAQKKLTQYHISHVTLIAADAVNGWPNEAPYDIIVITAASKKLATCFYQSLSVGGRMFAIIGDETLMTATIITRMNQDTWEHRKLFETKLPYFINSPQRKPFISEFISPQYKPLESLGPTR